jgi:sugar phosphate isomerase/epimerase
MPVSLSAFGDEIDPDLQTQLAVLKELEVFHLEFRSAWGKNVKDLSDDDLQRARSLCDENGIAVSCLGSPVGKTAILDPLEDEIRILERMFRAGEILQTNAIRIFSFYPPHDAPLKDFLEMSIERLRQLTDLAERAGFVLLLENDEELVGSTIENLHTILSRIDSKSLRHAWDGANFVASGEIQASTTGWDQLHSFVGTVHVKDFRLSDRSRRAAGEGDAELAVLFEHLKVTGYAGFLALEPHPYQVDGRGELKGAEGMRYAVAACRRVMQSVGLQEA